MTEGFCEEALEGEVLAAVVERIEREGEVAMFA